MVVHTKVETRTHLHNQTGMHHLYDHISSFLPFPSSSPHPTTRRTFPLPLAAHFLLLLDERGTHRLHSVEEKGREGEERESKYYGMILLSPIFYY